MFRFIDQETGELVILEDRDFVLENQDILGFLQHEGRNLKRDIAGEFAIENASRRRGAGKIDKVGPLDRWSESGAVHPEQVDLAREHWATVDPGISFDNSGIVRFSSRGARARFLKAAGFIDKDGGYSD